MTGLSDDPSDRPTRMTEIGADGSLQQVLDGEPELRPDAVELDSAPDPWYRNRVLLALWALLVALLLTLIGYGLVELSRGGGTSIPAPYTSSTTPTTSSTTTSPSPTPTTTESTPPETPEQTPEEAPPPPPNNAPAPTQAPRHHHHWHLPHLF